ncbi:nodulation protein NfeD [Ornithinibacillus gellani]|uniref:NfeD family protein n=1 Tax=Ornithinibacillus gellani TaxID=2293253 RepID=UPI000F493336|nr:NfeD family protein [Ornithinibacillus gellani]TQS74557.1 nodulation protein NfeD [Ornithinibacillus gellani]
MEIFSHDWIGLLITGFATMFLIGEILVNMRGLFALLGIGFITVYFSVYLETGSLMLMLIIYFIGLLLIIIDGKLLNDGTLATLGVASMFIAVALPAPSFVAGMYGVLGVLLGGAGSLLFLKVFKRREMWTKIALTDQLSTEAGYNSLSEEYAALINQTGETLNDFRPVGTLRINNKDYSAVSNGQWIPKHTKVKVVQVDGTKIMVEELTD